MTERERTGQHVTGVNMQTACFSSKASIGSGREIVFVAVMAVVLPPDTVVEFT